MADRPPKNLKTPRVCEDSGANTDVELCSTFYSNAYDNVTSDIQPTGEIVCELIGSFRHESYLKEIVMPGTSSVPDVIIPFATSKRRRGWMYAPRASKFEACRVIAKDFLDRYPERSLTEWVEDDLVEYDEPFRSNLHSFLVNLWAFKEGTEGREVLFNCYELLTQSLLLGPRFAKELDQNRAACVGHLNRCGFFSDEIESSFISGSKLTQTNFKLDSMFRPNSLFNWDAPEIDIEDVTSMPVEIKPDIAEEFRLATRAVLSNKKLNFFQPIKWEELESDNSKTCLEGKVYEQSSNPPAKVRGISRLVHVPRELKEKRAACVEEYTSSLRVRWIEANVQRILTVDKRSKMKLNASTISFELQHATKPYVKMWNSGKGRTGQKDKSTPYSYCRDFKKEGLTKPRRLVRIMLEELNRRFPRCEAFSEVGFFDEWNLQLPDGRIIHPARGHGLGMCSALTTLMQLSIETMNTTRCNITPQYSGYVNDDAVVIDKDREAILIYSKQDQITCNDLSLQFKTKATFIACGYAVLCEQYASVGVEGMSSKGIYYLQEFTNILKCVNKLHARTQARAMNTANIPKHIMTYVMDYWGWVLFRNEHLHSSHEGGWFRHFDKSVDMTFALRSGSKTLTDEQTASILADRSAHKMVLPWLQGKKEKNNKCYKTKQSKYYSDDFLEAANIPVYIDDIDMFRPTMQGKEETRSWNAYLHSLEAAYKRFYRAQAKMTVQDVYLDCLKRYPSVDIMPTEESVEYVYCDSRVIYNDIVFNHPYQGHGNRLDYEIYSLDNKRNEYNIRSANKGNVTLGFPKFGPYVHTAGHAARKILNDIPGYQIPGYKAQFYHAALIPTKKIMPHWHNPFHVVALADKWRKNRFTGVVCKHEPNEILKLRDKVYSRALTPDEWFEIGTINPFDQRIIMSVMTPEWTTEDIKGLCDDLRKYPGLGALINYQPDRKDCGYYTRQAFKKWAAVWELITEDISSLRENPDPDVREHFLAELDLRIDFIGTKQEYIPEGTFEIYDFDEFGDLDRPNEPDEEVLEVSGAQYDEFNTDIDDFVYDDYAESFMGFTPMDDFKEDYGDLCVTTIK